MTEVRKLTRNGVASGISITYAILHVFQETISLDLAPGRDYDFLWSAKNERCFDFHNQCAWTLSSRVTVEAIAYYETPHFRPRHRHPPSWKEQRGYDPTAPASCLHKWDIEPSAACECDAKEQTVEHVVRQCTIHRPPHGLMVMVMVMVYCFIWLSQ